MEQIAGSLETDSQNSLNGDCSFVWDDNSKLYFHASSGFYHDPNAGWYYSSRDGLYYKFEDGNYVLLHSDKDDKTEIYENEVAASENHTQDDPFLEHVDCGKDEIEPNAGNTECSTGNEPENLPPPSEWLEDTLIDLYLSGYSDPAVNAAADVTFPLKTDEVDSYPAEVNTDTYELEEGEWIPEDYHEYDVTNSTENVADEGDSWDEENWRAQYGQVINSSEEPTLEVPCTDLWDWTMVTKPRKDGKGVIAKLVGRLMKRSSKLHPSMPSGGGLLRTAPICEAHLDLVRVTTGQVYKLRSPSAKFLASLSAYDSSNPTKDWGFPELSVHRQSFPISKSSGKTESKSADGVSDSCLPSLPNQGPTVEKRRSNTYRDRAAERRALHGGFGVGPGQKNSIVRDDDSTSSSVPESTEEAAAEALNISFGSGSYARRILKSMGWKEGEALGKTTKGLLEPIQAEGNIGSAGLGWPQGRSKQRKV
ncbi:hypothetical protein FEM48_Zijuj05G0070800 [Ziziphus jujuba var. spinosa]|uniref:G-patch domain-containing protein n=1 Tax=Ziziphus jujuba var. spinosa TaxID=714518 RepID=A0A978VDI6_ZIZJJ|nr:hypothetical protein FEM48_Zijuj05G0070800 [Ziziphus jujuba var. spinosa]